MVKDVFSVSPKLKVTSSNVLFCPQHKDIQFTVTEDERNQKMFTFEKLKSEFEHFFLKNDSKQLMAINLIADN